MTCTCKKDIEAKLLTRFVESTPEASCHELTLQGYAFIFDASVSHKGCMPIEATAVYPLKKGGSKSRKTTENMIFTYCPFCGVKYEPKAGAA